MTTWTNTKLSIAIPVQITRNGEIIDVRKIGNDAARLFDPNTEGEKTFPEPNAYIEGQGPEPTHCLIRSQLVIDFVPMLSLPYRTADVWEPVLAQMAQERGKEMLTRAEIELLCAELLFDSECDNLVRIEYD